MNGCLEVGILQAYLDGESEAREGGAIEAHLAACGACASQLETMRSLAARVDVLLGALAEDPLSSGTVRLSRRHMGAWAALAAAILAAIALAGFISRSTARSTARDPIRSSIPRVIETSPAISRAPAVSTHLALRRRRSARPRTPEYFIRLDDSNEPILGGTVTRVNLPLSLFDPSQPVDSSVVVRAEVILGDDGQPKAIRFLQSQ